MRRPALVASLAVAIGVAAALLSGAGVLPPIVAGLGVGLLGAALLALLPAPRPPEAPDPAALARLQRLASVGELGAGLVHEIRNPLSSVIGFAQLGRRALAPDAPGARQLEIIEQEGRRAQAITQRLLDWTRAEAAEPTPLDPSAVARLALELVEDRLRIGGASCEPRLPAELPRIRGVQDELVQVLVNLLLNAMQAMEPQGGSVGLEAHEDGPGHVALVVRDQGRGIGPEERARLFTPFFTTRPRGEGTGLGLSVSLAIVRAHGGTIAVTSEPGVGSTFTVRLPITTA